jgi:hypothetical protein
MCSLARAIFRRELSNGSIAFCPSSSNRFLGDFPPSFRAYFRHSRLDAFLPADPPHFHEVLTYIIWETFSSHVPIILYPLLNSKQDFSCITLGGTV